MQYAVIGLFVAVGLGMAIAKFRAMRAASAKEEPTHRFHCPFCKRKLAYLQKQAGHKGMCPRCKQNIVFPHIVPTMAGKGKK